MVKLRKPLFITPLVACLLCMALWFAIPPQVASSQAPGDLVITNVIHYNLGANDIISDPFRGVIYASLPSAVGANGNRILPISIADGTLGTPLFVGSEPNRMALSADGQFLYVGLDGASAVRRVNLNSYSAELQISLNDVSCSSYIATDLVVLQDDPHTIAVAKSSYPCPSTGVVIYDDNVQRPDTTISPGGISLIEPSASPSLLYGYNTQYSYSLSTLVISSTGVGISSTYPTLFTDYVDFIFDDGFLYSFYGVVVDTLGMTRAGRYNNNTYSPIAPDSTAGIVYMMESEYGYPYDLWKLKRYNQTEFTLMDSFPLYNIDGGAKRLLHTGPRSFALLSGSGHLYLIELGEFVPAAPTFGSTPQAAASEQVEYTYSITATDPNPSDYASIDISASILPNWLNFSDGYSGNAYIYGTPSGSDIGANVVELVVKDSQGLSDTQRFTLTVVEKPGYAAPSFTSAPVTSAVENSPYAYQIIVDDPNDDYLYFYNSGLPSWLYLSITDNDGHAVLVGTPSTANIGEHEVELTVSDNTGRTDTQQFIITVEAAPPSADPSFSSDPILMVPEGVTYTYNILANDSDEDDVLTISASTLPSWLVFEHLGNGTARLSGKASQDEIGEHSVELLVTDSHGLTATQEFVLTVVDSSVNVPPAFGSTPVTAAAETITYSYIIIATDANVGDLLTTIAPVHPAWLGVTPLGNGAALLSGVASNADIGEHDIELLVTDSHGLTDTQSFVLTVVGVGVVEGKLFDDKNENKLQEEGEAGIAGATVSLTPEAKSLAAMIVQQAPITTTTSATGVYKFSQVPTGSYVATFDLPGDGANPAPVAIKVSDATPTIVAPVPVVQGASSVFLPAVKTPAKK